jgi:alanyl-tRNA synthetase
MSDTSIEIREKFLEFYRKKDHRVLKSSPLVPRDDPTLLFTSAGMVQFKRYYSSREPLEFTRAATIQKCLRATDLEQVGFTPRHLTFFEMLGHFSFGDYFKREAILWNWEMFTRDFGLPIEKLRVSVYEEDDEAFAIWRDEVGLAEDRIYRLGKEDNFWGPAGETGACGPSSELYFDLGPGMGCGRPECGPGCDCNRWVEVGNFVFPQFDMQPGGELAPLPNRGIDTGIGLERLAMVMEGKRSLFETSLFSPLIRRIEEISGVSSGGDLRASFSIIADHARALTFALAEGVWPANEGRGYVIRRVLRRAAVQGHRLGIDRPFLGDLSSEVVRLCAGFYPELKEAEAAVALALRLEEERFQSTLSQGLARFEEAAGRVASGKARSLTGDDVFQLYDTYGFPVDLTRVLATERGLEIDEAGFEAAMEEQRERSRTRAKFYQEQDGGDLVWTVMSEGPSSAFRGYETLEVPARIRRYAPIGNGGGARSGGSAEGRAEPGGPERASDRGNPAGGSREATGEPSGAGTRGATDGETGTEFWVVLDETPFYAESGGQVGDQGELEAPDFRARVLDVQHRDDQIWHRVRLESGEFPVDGLTARVDRRRRLDTMANHTATHLLHAALKQRLGPHVNQAGSLVAPDRLRFDFTHGGPLSPEEIREIEDVVNEKILEDRNVQTLESGYDEAIRDGVVALFGEKYGDRVRRIEIGAFSRELCGGTHCSRTGQIGAFLITHETGIAAGTRRIEAVTGLGAVREARGLRETVEKVRRKLPGSVAELPARVETLSEDNLRLRKQVAELKSRGPSDRLGPLRSKAEQLPGGKMLIGELAVEEGTDLRALADEVRQQLRSGAGLISVTAGEKTTLVAVVTDDLIERGVLRADEVVRAVAEAVGGRGGGRPHLAMAGLGDAARVPLALDRGRERIAAALAG